MLLYQLPPGGSAMSEMLGAALNYAERYRFNLLPAPTTGEKKPIGFGGTDFENATSDKVELEKRWLRNPDANIIRRVYGTVVIDVETEEGHPQEAKQARLRGEKFGIEALEELQEKRKLGRLPKTFMYSTWSGGLHITYNRPQIGADKTFKTKLAPGVELKSKGIVMMPPSVRDGKSYKMLDDAAIADFPEKWVEFSIKEGPDREEWDRVRPRGSGPTLCEEHGITMNQVMTLPSDARQTSDGYLIKHPIHGAAGDGNLYINTSKDLWCCYHSACDNSGGDPVTWVAVREGFISCNEAHGSLSDDVFLKCKDVLRREGIISDVMAEIPKKQRLSVEKLAQWLVENPKTLIAFYRSVIDDYHQGEWNLKTTMWRQTHRVAYHSAMALLHSDMTGPSRGGKTALMLRFLTLLPPGRKEVLTTLTPKAIWYKTLRWTEKQVPQVDKNSGEDKIDPKTGEKIMRKIRVKESDPNFYIGKVIAILELSEMKDFGVLKMLADEYEVGEYVHSTVIDHNSVELKIEGPHSVMTLSVKGIQNDVAKQVLNRFIQTPLDEPTKEGTAAKLEMIADHDLDESTIDKDSRLPILRRALELLWKNGYNVAVNPPTDDVRTLVKTIDRTLKRDGFNITQIRDFHTLALNAAFEKRFARGDPGSMQIQEEDAREAWFILTTFGNFARGNLTRAEFKLLSAIPDTAEESKDASDLREETELGVATINSALRVREDPVEGQGKFLQYGYVNYIQGNKAALFYRIQDGNEAVKTITTEIPFDDDTVKPLNPCPYPYKDLIEAMPDSVDSVEFENGPELKGDESDEQE
jgi:Bifunctional DNA primase/polymerase, N-terminal